MRSLQRFDAVSLETSQQRVKNECNGKFVLCHTYNGRIRMKRSAREQGVMTDGGKDEGTGNWIVISSPDDLFRHDVDVDFAKVDYKPMPQCIYILTVGPLNKKALSHMSTKFTKML